MLFLIYKYTFNYLCFLKEEELVLQLNKLDQMFREEVKKQNLFFDQHQDLYEYFLKQKSIIQAIVEPKLTLD